MPGVIFAERDGSFQDSWEELRMDEKAEATGMGQEIQIDDARIRDHLGKMVRGTVEEALNALLDAEADRPHTEERRKIFDTTWRSRRTQGTAVSGRDTLRSEMSSSAVPSFLDRIAVNVNRARRHLCSQA